MQGEEIINKASPLRSLKITKKKPTAIMSLNYWNTSKKIWCQLISIGNWYFNREKSFKIPGC